MNKLFVRIGGVDFAARASASAELSPQGPYSVARYSSAFASLRPAHTAAVLQRESAALCVSVLSRYLQSGTDLPYLSIATRACSHVSLPAVFRSFSSHSMAAPVGGATAAWETCE